MVQSEAVFQAIADSTRRQIINMLASKPMNVNAIADEFDVTRQAISLHIQCLRDCGLIVVTKQGRERHCQVSLDNLDVVTDWVNDSKRIWLERFQSLDKLLAAQESRKTGAIKRQPQKNRKQNGKRTTNALKKRR